MPDDPVKRAARFILPIVLYVGLIFFLSSRPASASVAIRFDKPAHFVEYAMLGALICRALMGYGVRAGRAVPLAMAIATSYGVTDEIHQAFVPERSPEALDLLADALGAIAGSTIWFLLVRKGAMRQNAAP